MNIYIIGPSRSAKTPISNQVAEAVKAIRISASDWVRNIFVPSGPVVTMEDKQRTLEEITRFSQLLLADNPNRCIDHIRQNYPGVVAQDGNYVLEGFRNPRDFLTLFNPAHDRVVFLTFPSSPLSPLTFETEGLALIEQTVNWFAKCGMMSAERILKVCLNDFSEVEMVAGIIIKWATPKEYVSLEEQMKHPRECPWWHDWHACNCGVLEQ